MQNGRNKKLGRGIKRFLAFTIAVFIVFSTLPAIVNAKEERTVRIAVFPLGAFQYFNEEGETEGYNIDYLNRIAQVTHWNYEYVEAKNFQDACTLLDEDKVDLVAPVQYREYLEQQYAYSAYTMATESAAIFVMNNEKNEDLLYEDFTTMKSMHFGMVKYNSSSFTNEFIDNYSVRNNFMPDNITYYNNVTELLAALEKGDIEAAVANILFTNEKYKMVGRFSPMTSYYIMQKNNNGLKDELDEAMSSIVLSDPGYQAELMSDYFQFYGISSFTYDEEEYIKTLPTIKVGYQVNHSPLSYTDENG